MNIIFYVNDAIAAGIVRGDVLARAINQSGKHSAVCKTELFLSDVIWADAVVFQRASTPMDIELLNRFRANRVAVLYDFDDDLSCIPPVIEGAHEYYSKPETQETITQLMLGSDVVTTSTKPLLQNVPDSCNRRVIANCVDLGHAKASLQPRSIDEVTIMWHGSQTHVDDVPLVVPPLKQILEEGEGKVKLHLVGHFTPEVVGDALNDLPVTYSGWLDPMSLYRGLAMADIGLCPLRDTRFNRAKSEIKWLEYGAVQVPCVVPKLDPYSMVIPYSDAMVVEDITSGDDWYCQINSLVKNAEMRAAIGAAARLRVIDEYDSRDRAKEWVSVIEAARVRSGRA